MDRYESPYPKAYGALDQAIRALRKGLIDADEFYRTVDRINEWISEGDGTTDIFP